MYAIISTAIITAKIIENSFNFFKGIFSINFNNIGKTNPIEIKIKTSQIHDIGNAI